MNQDVLEVLDRASTEGPALRLVGQLDRKLYEATNKALEFAGGKWDRKAKAHLFPFDADDVLDPILLTGVVPDLRDRTKQDFQAFFTPEALAPVVIAKAMIEPGMSVLEPSAGEGSLARKARDAGGDVRCVEIHPSLCEVLRETVDPEAVCADFLRTDVIELGGPFDRAVMNPPFSKQQDARHVLHAVKMLKPGGRLVSIMSAAVTYRDTPLYREVRDLILNSGGACEALPDGSFKESGTAVNTVLVTINATPVEAA
ncbi:methyltransferase [Phenylobacterium sp.]|uniref:methyltransferase n=1 Tax=Phenylobacterium sp. TaxID=1871053 RepID=UPI002FC6492F